MSARQCGVPWPVCPSCLGEGLLPSYPRAALCPRCGRVQGYDSATWRCPMTASVLLEEPGTGVLAPVCTSHAAHPSVRRWERRPTPPRKGGAA